ncbi:MAG: peptidase M15A [Chlorobiales bacterium]|jgi:hypothetical protein|nr:peptidase M15A [Chlorobiales bacterium]
MGILRGGWLRLVIFLLSFGLFSSTLRAADNSSFNPGKISFWLKVKDLKVNYKTFSVFVLPDEKLSLEVIDPYKQSRYTLDSPVKAAPEDGGNKWQWRAPSETGLYSVKISDAARQESITLNVFVMVPASKQNGEYLNGYRVGEYPSTALNGNPAYEQPKGFIEVTDKNQETQLSPHFKLKQFLCKQPGTTKYLVLEEKLLVKLEHVLQKVNELGYACESFNVMSGYRTPYYNRSIGNVMYSRHVYGSAADIFIDESPKDGVMDDLNKDGRIDKQDAEVLYDVVEAMYGGETVSTQLVGGIGVYNKNASHGPFIHVDVRGTQAHWGMRKMQ